MGGLPTPAASAGPETAGGFFSTGGEIQLSRSGPLKA